MTEEVRPHRSAYRRPAPGTAQHSKALRGEIKQLEAEAAELKRDLKKSLANYAALNKTAANLRRVNRRYERERASMQIKVRDLQEENQKLKTELFHAQTAVGELSRDSRPPTGAEDDSSAASSGGSDSESGEVFQNPGPYLRRAPGKELSFYDVQAHLKTRPAPLTFTSCQRLREYLEVCGFVVHYQHYKGNNTRLTKLHPSEWTVVGCDLA